MVFHRSYNIGFLDKVAYGVLAISYSGVYVDDPGVQRYIGQPCVAAAFYQGYLMIAANNVWRTNGPGIDYAESENDDNVGNNNVFQLIVQYLRSDGINEPICILGNPLGESDTTYHAELQLFDYSGGQFQGNVIGVSKPCCQTCANELHNAGIGITDFHGGPTTAAHPYGQLPYVAYIA